MSFLSPDISDNLRAVQNWLGRDFPQINKVRTDADTVAGRLEKLLVESRSVPDDASFVVYGSLARSEWTSSSDLDWSLLIDGAVDPSVLQVVLSIRETIRTLEIKDPGREGIFGSLSFSHDLVHQIGGQSDTNRNLTQRILLLLESRVIGDELAYERVIRAVLERYCEEDVHLYSRKRAQFKVPRFLLNDVVRFWRTMAVDYASKRRERNSKGWALRNAKLRCSRKLLFVSGLIMCVMGPLHGIPGEKDAFSEGQFSVEPLINFLTQFAERTPLDIVSDLLIRNNNPITASTLLSAYDDFLRILMDADKRNKLDSMPFEGIEESPLFQEVRKIGGRFQESAEQMFFHDNTKLSAIIREYGVF
jgi:predicted nucleotidyltransferase